MIFINFIIISMIVVISSVKLSKEAEKLERSTKINAAIIGIILAFATSLPELITGLTSLFIGQEEMVLGNILGSNAFNLLILAFLNIIFIKQLFIYQVDKSVNKINFFVLVMYIALLLNFVIVDSIIILGRIAFTSIIIIISYLFLIKTTNNQSEEVIENNNSDNLYNVNKIIRNFILLSIIITIAAILLAKNASLIVIQTGLNSVIVGALFIGIATSLPELSSCFSLIKNRSYTIAASSVLGSNAFNLLILAILDIIYPTSLLEYLNNIVLGLIIIGIIFTSIYLVTLRFKINNKIYNVFPSILLIIIYISFFLTRG